MDIERVKMSEKIYYSDEKGKHEAKNQKLDYILSWQQQINQEESLIEAEQTKKDADRASAMAKLSKLGLTDDEIASLIP
jgi:hypothetical protein